MFIMYFEHSRRTEQRVASRKTLSYTFGDAKKYEGGVQTKNFQQKTEDITNIFDENQQFSWNLRIFDVFLMNYSKTITF